MEGGLVADFAKLVLDADQLTMMESMVAGIDTSDNGLALDALRETGLASTSWVQHTQANFETAFWRSMEDYSTFEQWSLEGSRESAERARQRAIDMLASYEAPELDPEIVGMPISIHVWLSCRIQITKLA